MNNDFEDFTEAKYHALLKLAKANWNLIGFADYRLAGRCCLWRHDIDHSVHRAYRLAKIEAEENIKTTYFIHLHNEFYNFLEAEIAELIFKISDLGHDLGLHFDPKFYSERFANKEDLTCWLKFEQEILEKTFQVKIQAFSFHQPDVGNWLNIDQDEIGGMVNAYGKYLRLNYGYCSDSNGYWRFSRLQDVLQTAEDEKIHILTHPEWWTPEPMSPRDRISRCIAGRAEKQHQQYDSILYKEGRKNIRK